MHIRTLIACAGLASVAIAQPPETAVGAAANPEKTVLNNQRAMSADQIGHIYYNAATGEMIRTKPNQSRGLDDSAPVWINELYDQCAFAEWFYNPIRDSATGEDTYWTDWGDITPESVIDAMTFLIATSVSDPEADGEEGFEMDVSFFDAVDVGSFTSTLAPYLVYTFTGLPGSASGGVVGWLLTIDVSGGGEFEIGDINGVDDTPGQTGFTSGGAGEDIDGDDLADFAYGFNFRHPKGSLAVSGPGLAGPSPETAPGDEDGAALFDGGWDNFTGLFDFGGYQCDKPGHQWTPWASAYIGLYGPGGIIDCDCGDLTCDGKLDFFDVQVYLDWFAAEDPRADMNADGVLDFFDVLIFLALFSAGCP